MWAIPTRNQAEPRLSGVALVLCFLACNQPITAFPASYVGVGVELTLKGETPSVVRVIDGSPAAQAGLAAGSSIVAVDGKDTRGKGLADVVNSLRGPADSQVVLDVTRDGAAPYRVTIHRRALSKAASDGGHYVTGSR